MLTASIGDVTFTSTPGSNAFVIDPDGFTGWDEGVTMRRQEILLPSGHGAFETPGFMGPRVTTISGASSTCRSDRRSST